MRIHSPQITGSAENTNIVTVTRITSLSALSASFASTASYWSGSIVNAATASYADNFTVGGTLTAQTINVQIITSSIEFNTGSTRNGALSTNTHEFTGSVSVSGSVGIGTNAPSQLLEVVGGEIKAGRVDSTNEGGQVSFGRASDNNTAWYIDAYGNVASPQLRFVDVTGAAVRMTLTGSNVGIGTSTPNAPLQVSSATGTNVNPAVSITNTSLNGYGVLRLTGNSRGGFIDFYDNTSAQASIVGQGGAFYIYTNGDSSGTPKVTIASAGAATFSSTVTATRFTSAESTVAIPNSATTIFDAGTGGSGVWLVTAVVQGNGIQAGYAIVGMRSESTLYLLASGAGGQMTFSVSGTTLRLSQSAGGTINTSISVMKINQGG
jgi:hypothetical protein